MQATLRLGAAAAATLALAGCSGDDAPSSPPTSATATPTEDTGASADPTGETAAPEIDLPPPPGDLVDVDGRQQHLYCTGDGTPTVLLEAGQGDVALIFTRVQEELAATTRVCTYDRAGLGWSEPSPQPRTGQQMVAELEALLEAAEEPGPYVLAGHSLGGLVVLRFAEENPDSVAGVVLIDASHPEQEARFADQFPRLDALSERQVAQRDALAARVEAGEVEAGELFPYTPVRLPLDVREQMATLSIQPHTWRTIAAEDDGFEQTASQVGGAGSLGDIPLVVVASGLGLEEQISAYDRQQAGITTEMTDRFDTIWRGLQEDHLTRSTDARLVVAEESTHYVQLDEREVVIDAIRSLLGTG